MATPERDPLGDRQALYLRRRADVKIARALRIGALRLSGLSYEAIRIQMGLSIHQFSHAKRWLGLAVARSVGSPEPISVDEAMREHGAEHVATAVRIGSLLRDGYPRREVMRMLRLTPEQYDEANGWLRDAITQDPRDDDLD